MWQETIVNFSNEYYVSVRMQGPTQNKNSLNQNTWDAYKRKSVALSPLGNYTDQAIATGQRS
jgi:hypothetical protein